MRIVVFKFPNVSPTYLQAICQIAHRLEYDIEGFVSMDPNDTATSFDDYPIYPLTEINKLSWDAAVLACSKTIFKEIVPRMVALKIGTENQFKSIFWPLQQLMIQKYEDFADPVIQETLEYWKTNDVSVFNQHIDYSRGTFDRVFEDEPENLPYIYFKTVGGDWRKMYLASRRDFTTYNGQTVLENILKEQDPTSPHLYTTGDHQVREGDIIIDAGVCEGNFALKYVDICSKMYLFESDPKWVRALELTFKDYRHKVEIIPRFVANVTDDEHITIDDALGDVRGKNIFLKMDVEGFEPDALRGAKNILTNNHVRASVCTYHNADDLVKVKSIFRKFGYQTSTSAGYMVFTIDPNIFNTADFRKGVVYAVN